MIGSLWTSVVRYFRVTRGKRILANRSFLCCNLFVSSCFNHRNAASYTCDKYMMSSESIKHVLLAEANTLEGTVTVCVKE